MRKATRQSWLIGLMSLRRLALTIAGFLEASYPLNRHGRVDYVQTAAGVVPAVSEFNPVHINGSGLTNDICAMSRRRSRRYAREERTRDEIDDPGMAGPTKLNICPA